MPVYEFLCKDCRSPFEIVRSINDYDAEVVCPECGRLVEVGDSRCPFCGSWQPAMFGYSRALQNVFGSLDITTFIFWTCIILYLVSLILDPRAIVRGSGFMDLLAPSGESLVRRGMPNAYGGQRFHFGRDYLIPKPFDKRVLVWEAHAVAKAAIEEGVARRSLDLAPR